MWKWARLALLGNTRSIRLVNFDTKASLSHINLVKIGPPDLQGAVTRVIGIWTILIRPQQLSLTEAGDDVAGGRWCWRGSRGWRWWVVTLAWSQTWTSLWPAILIDIWELTVSEVWLVRSTKCSHGDFLILPDQTPRQSPGRRGGGST